MGSYRGVDGERRIRKRKIEGKRRKKRGEEEKSE